MKLTDREKILLVLLGGLIFVGLYMNFILLPQLESIKALESRSAVLDRQIEEIELYADPQGKAQQDFKALNDTIATMTARFFPTLKQETLILILNDMIVNSGINGNTLAFTPISVGPVEVKGARPSLEAMTLRDLADKYHGTRDNTGASSNNTNANKDTNLEKMEVNIQYQGSYSNVIQLLNEIETYPRKIHVSRISLAADQSRGEITGSISLHFYGLPKLHDQDGDLAWQRYDIYGRNNPFAR